VNLLELICFIFKLRPHPLNSTTRHMACAFVTHTVIFAISPCRMVMVRFLARWHKNH